MSFVDDIKKDLKSNKSYSKKDLEDISLWKENYKSGNINDSDVVTLSKGLVERKYGRNPGINPVKMSQMALMGEDVIKRVTGKTIPFNWDYSRGFEKALHNIGKKLILSTVGALTLGTASKIIDEGNKSKKVSTIKEAVKKVETSIKDSTEKLDPKVKEALKGVKPEIFPPSKPIETKQASVTESEPYIKGIKNEYLLIGGLVAMFLLIIILKK